MLQDIVEVPELPHDLMPVTLSNNITYDFSMSLDQKLMAAIEVDIVTADDG